MNWNFSHHHQGVADCWAPLQDIQKKKNQNSFLDTIFTIILGEFMRRQVHSVVHYSNHYLRTQKSDRRTHWNQHIWDSIHYLQFSLDKNHAVSLFSSISPCFLNYMCGSDSATLHCEWGGFVFFQLRRRGYSCCDDFYKNTNYIHVRTAAVSREENQTVANWFNDIILGWRKTTNWYSQIQYQLRLWICDINAVLELARSTHVKTIQFEKFLIKNSKEMVTSDNEKCIKNFPNQKDKQTLLV